MAEYTFKDVIIDPEDPRVEIGMKYYRADFPKRVLYLANAEDYIGTLEDIDTENPEAPFVVRTGNACSPWACLIRKKEPSYVERQDKWLAENGIKEGDMVRVTRKADSYECGWDNSWNYKMDETVGKIGKIFFLYKIFDDVGIEVIIPEVGNFAYPFFVLEKVEQKYVPFDLSDKEVRDELRGKWIIPKGHSDSIEKQITLFGSQMTEYGKIWCVDMDITSDKLLSSWTFIDGTPCGKLEMVEE